MTKNASMMWGWSITDARKVYDMTRTGLWLATLLIILAFSLSACAGKSQANPDGDGSMPDGDAEVCTYDYDCKEEAGE